MAEYDRERERFEGDLDMEDRWDAGDFGDDGEEYGIRGREDRSAWEVALEFLQTKRAQED